MEKEDVQAKRVTGFKGEEIAPFCWKKCSHFSAYCSYPQEGEIRDFPSFSEQRLQEECGSADFPASSLRDGPETRF